MLKPLLELVTASLRKGIFVSALKKSDQFIKKG
jgi:hypothetical protein